MNQDEDAWAATWAARVGDAVRNTRQTRGLSAQALSDKTSALGHLVPRNTIVNLERHRKRSVAVDEVVILACALGTSPMALLFPVEVAPTSEPLPGREVATLHGAMWFAQDLLDPAPKRVGTPLHTWYAAGMATVEIDELRSQLDQARAEEVRALREQDERSAERMEFAQAKIAYIADRISRTRAQVDELVQEMRHRSGRDVQPGEFRIAGWKDIDGERREAP